MWAGTVGTPSGLAGSRMIPDSEKACARGQGRWATQADGRGRQRPWLAAQGPRRLTPTGDPRPQRRADRGCGSELLGSRGRLRSACLVRSGRRPLVIWDSGLRLVVQK